MATVRTVAFFCDGVCAWAAPAPKMAAMLLDTKRFRQARFRQARAAAFGFLIAAGITPATAQNEAEPARGSGHLSAVAGGRTLPAGATIRIVPDPATAPESADPLYRTARAAAENALTARGYRVVRDAAYVLVIELSVPQRDGRLDNLLVEPLPGAGAGESIRVVPQFRVPLDDAGRADAGRIAVSLLLTDDGGNAMWSASIAATDGFRDAETTVRRLVATALDTIGARAERDFVLDCSNEARRNGLCLD